MNWEAMVQIPVAVLVLIIAPLLYAITGVFKGWIIPGPTHQLEIRRTELERKAKDDALAANKDLIEANNLLLHRDDLSITTLREIRDYIQRHDRAQLDEGEKGGSG